MLIIWGAGRHSTELAKLREQKMANERHTKFKSQKYIVGEFISNKSDVT